MAKISVVDKAKSCANGVFSFCDEGYQTRRFRKMAKDFIDKAVNNLEKILEKVSNQPSQPNQIYQELRDLLCMAYFGKGLAEGISEMKDKTERGHSRSFSEITTIVKEFNDVCIEIAREPYIKQNHLRLGRAYGALGSACDGQKMLDRWTYWSNINEYIKDVSQATKQ